VGGTSPLEECSKKEARGGGLKGTSLHKREYAGKGTPLGGGRILLLGGEGHMEKDMFFLGDLLPLES